MSSACITIQLEISRRVARKVNAGPLFEIGGITTCLKWQVIVVNNNNNNNNNNPFVERAELITHR
jgi:hypothetical protein